MKKIELEIKGFSTKKLKEIIEKQSDAYSERFTDYAKSELIKRGETFTFDANLQKLVKELSDDDLKTVVEKERADYNFEYLELAIQEYIARGFKNEMGYDEPNAELEPDTIIEKSYPALRTFSAIYVFVGLLSFAAILFVLFNPKIPSWLMIPLIMICIFGGVSFFATAEAIKVFLAIEENTRRKGS